MVFPLAKLLALGLKQVSRHVSNFVKARAKNNERFKSKLVTSAGWYHKMQTKLRRRYQGLENSKEVKPLSEQLAVDLGVELLGDFVTVVCAVLIYVFIEARSSKHKEEEERQKFEEMKSLKQLVVFQSIELENQAAKLREFERIFNGSTMFSQTSDRVMTEFSEKDKELDNTR